MRAPGGEVEPSPQPGERVVFGAHLDRGLGLPVSAFFRRFLDNFLQHHLPANACILLSCFVAFMEAYAGLWPDIDFWSRLFYLKAQTDGRCGPAAPPRSTLGLMSFFYVRNEGQLVDRINLPEFNPAPPVGRINWSYNARTADPDAEMRTHKIGHMSGRLDPNRTSKVALTKAQVAHRVNNVTKANMPEWSYGLAPMTGTTHPVRGRGAGDVRHGANPCRAPAREAAKHHGDFGAGKRAGDPHAALEAKVKKLAGFSRRRAPIKFAQGGGSRQTPRVVSPPPRQRRESKPQPPTRAPMPPPPAGTPPPAGAPSFAVPLASAPDRGTRVEPTRQPTLDDMFPRRSRLLDRRGRQGMPPSTGRSRQHRPRPGRAGPNVVVWMKTRRGISGAGDGCAAGPSPPSVATTGSDDGGADHAGAGKG
ncbi:hypothetical protein QYE76_040822 [Lolium multiflorum]|uniref:Transposase (putative) gypsy type domain-containing protein n=1 Tax=Lolium multiflorum TaxID=4521 RepID=A0AAD8TC79_LOLMU|nr:hypothetical protein QYE76_040822 [Lolium multiflorum]